MEAGDESVVSISLSSGFSFQGPGGKSYHSPPQVFQSRYRAAFHFRFVRVKSFRLTRPVSISLSSGFSFQVRDYASRYSQPIVSISLSSGFSFQVFKVIVRSGVRIAMFQSRYRAAFHFRAHSPALSACANSFQSRYRAAFHFRERVGCGYRKSENKVSISLSSGFSFQVAMKRNNASSPISPFQSRYQAAFHFRLPDGSERIHAVEVSISLSSGFSFQVMLLMRREKSNTFSVSISLSSGFSFQGDDGERWTSVPPAKFQSRYRAAFHFRRQSLHGCPELFMFQSRYRAAFHFRAKSTLCCTPAYLGFNLVIERLFISGTVVQFVRRDAIFRFNLVIERLFISGKSESAVTAAPVEFQSRYRAAFHFRSTPGNSRCIHL